mmetsp:Transcript_7400/g.9388  ORF Transcript_7400/g.9388 Transcript_7400/m.9388 type:complete len:591 (-) Transcript_7400:185-1957(-)
MFWKYTVGSTALTVAVIRYALVTREHFYPAVVYLVTSKVSIALLGNQILVFTLLLGRLAKCIFLGSLREVEVELLYENARYAITETCLALTIFREELTTRVLALFTALLFAKVFHWLASSRVDYLEHADRVSPSTHVRLTALMTWLAFVDGFAVGACGYLCYINGPSVLLLFGFEFAILAVAVYACAARYLLFLAEHRFFDGQWPGKGGYVFAVDFFAEFARLLLYVAFFAIVFSRYGVPLHIIRELWLSYVSLKRRLTAYRRYRALTTHMDERFADATDQELDECGRVCIICREHMDSAKKLPCGHIFHLACLRLWFQQQQSCPTCRADVPTEPVNIPTEINARVQENNATPQANPPQENTHPEQQNQQQTNEPTVEIAHSNAPHNNSQQQQQQHLERAVPTETRDAAAPLRRPNENQANAAVWRVIATDGAAVFSQRRTDASVHRRIMAGACVLALENDGNDTTFLRLGDGWILRDTVIPYPIAEQAHTQAPNVSATTTTIGNDERIFKALAAIQADLAEIKLQLRNIRRNQATGKQPSDPVEETKAQVPIPLPSSSQNFTQGGEENNDNSPPDPLASVVVSSTTTEN